MKSGIDTVMIWDQSHETMEREELAQLQLERLQASIYRAYSHVAFYRKRFDALGIAPEDIQLLEDLRRLPFTSKEDLRNGYPYELLAVPLREVVRLHNSSWSIERPTVCAFTRNDLRHWNDLIARILTAGGVTRDDVVQIFFGAGLLTSGLGFHGGAERLGASVIPSSPHDIIQQLAIMQDFRTTALIGTSSDAVHFAQVVAEKGLDIRRLSVRVGLFGAEPWSETLREQIEHALGITALDHYGFSEVGGPGVAGECLLKCGLHVAEDHFLVEIIDPVTGTPVADGQNGELVLTTLTREALPLLRFRTRDITRLDNGRCGCGRTMARLSRITARTDDLLIVQGRKLYPAQVAAILADIEGAQPHHLIIIERKSGVEEVEILVELLSGLSIDSLGKVLAIEQRIADRVQSATGLTPRVRVMEAQSITAIAGSAAGSVIDRRD